MSTLDRNFIDELQRTIARGRAYGWGGKESPRPVVTPDQIENDLLHHRTVVFVPASRVPDRDARLLRMLTHEEVAALRLNNGSWPQTYRPLIGWFSDRTLIATTTEHDLAPPEAWWRHAHAVGRAIAREWVHVESDKEKRFFENAPLVPLAPVGMRATRARDEWVRAAAEHHQHAKALMRRSR